jgi:hypothetical protein
MGGLLFALHRGSRRRGDARGNCLNLKGVIAIKLVAAPRYHLRRFAALCAGMRHLPSPSGS